MAIYADVVPTPDFPVVKFSDPQELVKLDFELKRMLNSTPPRIAGVGTYFRVQFLSHDKKKLLSSALFVVTTEMEERHTNEDDPYRPVSTDLFKREYKQVEKWWPPASVSVELPDAETDKKQPRARKTA